MAQDADQPPPETADIETSSDDYASRFAGKTGEWMLKVQEDITVSLMKSMPNATVLDVGGGHGQLAAPLCRTGFKVTVLGSDESCRSRIAGLIDAGQCEFKTGDVVGLPFPDRSFDVCVSFRLLTHCGRWPQLLSELCRVARRAVIVDYPTSQSLNAIAPLLFGAKKRIEGNTRTWALFKHADIREQFGNNGFSPSERKAQFFLPMVLHRALKCRPLSAALEDICAALGLTHLWGSPVIMKADRKEENANV